MPRPRSWYANLRAHPRFIVHLKHGVTADLPATAAPVDEPTRRRVITAVLDLQNRPDIAARVGRRQDLDEWLARSPLVEIVFDDERLRTSSSAQSGQSEPHGSRPCAAVCGLLTRILHWALDAIRWRRLRGPLILQQC
jgi:hypothetical protein